MRQRNEVGWKKYGQPLRAGDGRRHLIDAYQECLDMAVYLRQEIEERSILQAEIERLRGIFRKIESESCISGYDSGHVGIHRLAQEGLRIP